MISLHRWQGLGRDKALSRKQLKTAVFLSRRRLFRLVEVASMLVTEERQGPPLSARAAVDDRLGGLVFGRIEQGSYRSLCPVPGRSVSLGICHQVRHIFASLPGSATIISPRIGSYRTT